MTLSAREAVEPLLPCPFCGGDAHIGTNPHLNGSWVVRCKAEMSCAGRGGTYPPDQKHLAIAAWNRRSLPLPSAVEEPQTEDELGAGDMAKPDLGHGDRDDLIAAAKVVREWARKHVRSDRCPYYTAIADRLVALATLPAASPDRPRDDAAVADVEAVTLPPLPEMTTRTIFVDVPPQPAPPPMMARIQGYGPSQLEDYARAAVLADRAARSGAAPEGWQLVPKEPTDAMIDGCPKVLTSVAWRAMYLHFLRTAPSAMQSSASISAPSRETRRQEVTK